MFAKVSDYFPGLMRALRLNRIVVVAVAVCLALVAGCTREAETPATHVVILGLDAGTWDLLDPYIERGLLPNLAKLRANGTSGPLQSMKQSSSPVVWTSIATGKKPEKHGITSFVRFPTGDTGKPGPVTSTMRQGKAFWNIVGPRGYDVAIVGWFVTWPVEDVNGRMISDRAHWGEIDEKGVFPPAYLNDVAVPTFDEARAAMRAFMDFDYDPDLVDKDSTDPAERINYLVFDRFVRAWIRDTYYLRAAERILEDGALPRVLALYLRGTDDVQHGFWKFMEPEPFGDVTPEQAARFGKVIERYWQWADQAVGRVLAYYDNTPRLVIVASDHGAGPAVGVWKINVPEYLHLSGSHREKGIFIAEGPGIRRGERIDDAEIYDITPTLLQYLGMPVGADMDGKILGEIFTGALAKRPIETVATHDEASDLATGYVASAADEKALEHLKSLGYIDEDAR